MPFQDAIRLGGLGPDTQDALAELVLAERPIHAYDLARELRRPRALETVRQLQWLVRAGYAVRTQPGKVPHYEANQKAIDLCATWTEEMIAA